MKYIVIDVREPEEFATGHIDGAINIPPSTLMTYKDDINGIPKGSNIIVYCKTGSRSNMAKNILENLGYKNITNGINKEQVKARLGL